VFFFFLSFIPKYSASGYIHVRMYFMRGSKREDVVISGATYASLGTYIITVN